MPEELVIRVLCDMVDWVVERILSVLVLVELVLSVLESMVSLLFDVFGLMVKFVPSVFDVIIELVFEVIDEVTKSSVFSGLSLFCVMFGVRHSSCWLRKVSLPLKNKMGTMSRAMSSTMCRGDMPVLAAAIDGVTTLIAIFPNAIVGWVVEITRNFGNLYNDTGLLVLREGQRSVVIWTSWANALVEAAQAVLSAWPFGDGEFASFVEIRRPLKVTATLCIVKPFTDVTADSWISLEIFDVETFSGVNISGVTLLVKAEFEDSESMVGRFFSGRVPRRDALGINSHTVIVAVLALDGVALA